MPCARTASAQLAASSRCETVEKPDGGARQHVVVHEPEERRRGDDVELTEAPAGESSQVKIILGKMIDA
jgi:hypothetical protein